MIFKPCYHFETGCAAYLFGCGSLGKCAVVDAHLVNALSDVSPKPVEMERILRAN
jgi:hypothetical protein